MYDVPWLFDENIHVTRLKNRILAQVPDLVSHTDKHSKGQGILLVFRGDVDDMVDEALTSRDYDSDALQMARAAEIVRRVMLEMQLKFTGSFPSDCQKSSVPTSLKAIIQMMLYGPNIKNRESTLTPNHAVSISQL